MNPDAVIVVGSPGDAAKVAIEVRRQGMTQQILGSGALYGDEFLKSGGKAVEGAITSAQFWRDDPDPDVRALVGASRSARATRRRCTRPSPMTRC